jgi:two-component system cell cycle sensor histidine kinase/response regulator CckA
VEAGGKVGRGEVVLVAEDDALVRTILVRSLEEAGFGVLRAADGTAALELAANPEQRVDAVVTDLAMPGLRGRELAEQLERLRPGIPVLFVSGHANYEVARRGLLYPGRPFLQKPFDPEALALKVRELLDRR